MRQSGGSSRRGSSQALRGCCATSAWRLLDVTGRICLVGSDEQTNAYKGDADLDQELPVLCIRKSALPVPEGVDPNDAYAGWSGSTVRLSRPLSGKTLRSLDVANKLIEDEFGKGWRMAEFHDTRSGGWHWWAYWGAAPDSNK